MLGGGGGGGGGGGVSTMTSLSSQVCSPLSALPSIRPSC